MSGGGQNGSAHTQAALLSGRRMGLDRGGRIVRGARAQPRATHVLRRDTSVDCAQFSAFQFRICRYPTI